MAGGLVDATLRGWRDPRGAMAAELDRGLSEARALAELMFACGLFFVASLPNAIREARSLAIADPVEGAVAAHLFGYLALAPLLAYGFAALVHLVARGFGAERGFGAARAALFRSLLLVAPVAIALALAGVAVEVAVPSLAPLLDVLGVATLAFWLWLFAASLAEAEGFAATRRVAAVVVASLGAVAGLVGLFAAGGA
jgi:hypothetical protein